MRLSLFWVLLVVLAFTSVLHSEDTWSGVSRIVAVGDVHGDFVEFPKVLRMAGVIDQDNNWSGGKTHRAQKISDSVRDAINSERQQ